METVDCEERPRTFSTRNLEKENRRADKSRKDSRPCFNRKNDYFEAYLHTVAKSQPPDSIHFKDMADDAYFFSREDGNAIAITFQ